jgi:DNA invertase Pin-like site-specific DNA recombinase
VVRWVDRLGRNYQDVTDAVREFIRRGIRIETVINRMAFDGTALNHNIGELIVSQLRIALPTGIQSVVFSRSNGRGCAIV